MNPRNSGRRLGKSSGEFFLLFRRFLFLLLIPYGRVLLRARGTTKLKDRAQDHGEKQDGLHALRLNSLRGQRNLPGWIEINPKESGALRQMQYSPNWNSEPARHPLGVILLQTSDRFSDILGHDPIDRATIIAAVPQTNLKSGDVRGIGEQLVSGL